MLFKKCATNRWTSLLLLDRNLPGQLSVNQHNSISPSCRREPQRTNIMVQMYHGACWKTTTPVVISNGRVRNVWIVAFHLLKSASWLVQDWQHQVQDSTGLEACSRLTKQGLGAASACTHIMTDSSPDSPSAPRRCLSLTWNRHFWLAPVTATNTPTFSPPS